LLPQPASNRTTRARNSLKQGVVRVPNIKEMFIMPDGSVKSKEEMTPEELRPFAKKAKEMITKLAYELVMKDLEREQKAAN